MSELESAQGADNAAGATLTLSVYAPIAVDPKTFTWHRSTRAGEAAAEAAAAFGYEAGTPTLQARDGQVLDRDRPLAAANLRDGDELELVDVGGGV